MKRIVVLLLLLTSIPAISADLPNVKFNGNNYSLFFSAKSDGTHSYINEYYKKNETYLNWSELIAVHHFPEAFYPIDHANEFYSYLRNFSDSKLFEKSVNDESNLAVVDFIVISEKTRPYVIEYNIFRYEKDKICGTIALQYAKRYFANNRIEEKKIIANIEKERKKSLKIFNKLNMPELILADIDTGKYIDKKDVAEPVVDSNIKEDNENKEIDIHFQEENSANSVENYLKESHDNENDSSENEAPSMPSKILSD